MAYPDLRAFIAELENRKLLKKITVEVDAELEITEISDRVVKAGGPALYFANVKGYKMPVVTNLFGTMERMKLALGVEDLDRIGNELISILQPSELPTTFLDKLKTIPRLAKLSSYLPKVVRNGPCKEVVHLTIPAGAAVLEVLARMAGRLLPCLGFTRSGTGRRNVGMYRMQVYNETTTGMHWHIHKDGAAHCARLRGSTENACGCGAWCRPGFNLCSYSPASAGIDEVLCRFRVGNRWKWSSVTWIWKFRPVPK